MICNSSFAKTVVMILLRMLSFQMIERLIKNKNMVLVLQQSQACAVFWLFGEFCLFVLFLR